MPKKETNENNKKTVNSNRKTPTIACVFSFLKKHTTLAKPPPFSDLEDLDADFFWEAFFFFGFGFAVSFFITVGVLRLFAIYYYLHFLLISSN